MSSAAIGGREGGGEAGCEGGARGDRAPAKVPTPTKVGLHGVLGDAAHGACGAS